MVLVADVVKVPQETAPVGMAVLTGDSVSSFDKRFLLLPALTSLAMLSKSGVYAVSLAVPDVVVRSATLNSSKLEPGLVQFIVTETFLDSSSKVAADAKGTAVIMMVRMIKRIDVDLIRCFFMISFFLLKLEKHPYRVRD